MMDIRMSQSTYLHRMSDFTSSYQTGTELGTSVGSASITGSESVGSTPPDDRESDASNSPDSYSDPSCAQSQFTSEGSDGPDEPDELEL